MPNSNRRSKVTIEDLLQLKRAERPAAEFWSNFERELRQKQLAALLEKRPWWQELPKVFTRRAYLPIGATAVLAFTLVSIKYYTPAQVGQLEGAPVAAPVALSHQNDTSPVQPSSAQVSSPLVNRHDQTVSENSGRTASLASEESSPAKAAETSPVVTAPYSTESPSARSIAANLARLEQSEPELINAVLGNRLSPSARVLAAPGPVVELASLATSTSKRSRLLAHYDDRPLNPEPTAPDLVRERLSRRLGDAEFIERFNRISLKGDQVSLGLTLRL
jgi:hypothetical protein